MHLENQPQNEQENWIVWERHEGGVINYKGEVRDE